MELKTPSESEAVSLPDYSSDPEEQEFSDDDRNHKHRRRDTRSQSLERDQPEQFFSRSYRKHGKPFENLCKESDPHHYNLDREFPSKFGHHSSMSKSTQFSSNANQRLRTNQSFSGDFGFGRGRSRNSGSWNSRDSRFTPTDIPPGPLPPIFTGRGLHNVAKTQSSPWAGGFGLISGIPNGALDPIHPLGLQGAFRPPLNRPLNMGIPHQRCRDFEELGFCLRGDMCPMEHGVNRIVVEDVQSLSQFNLPASLPSGNLLGNPGGNGLAPTVNASSSILMNSKGLSAKANESGIDDGSYNLAGDGNGADVYDPDQPLWNSDCPQTSSAILTMQTPPTGDIEPFMAADSSTDQLVSSSGASIGLQSTSSSVQGGKNPLLNRMESGGRADSRLNSSVFPKSRNNEKSEMYTSVHGKRTNAGELLSSSSRLQNDYGRLMRKSTQKALRTLFVSHIPMTDNKKETLFSHLKKFGEIIDIHIPLNSDRAFVQFSKREEAERALKSPEAVMGNRFIKLLWANRDIIVDDSIISRNTMLKPSANASKENNQLGAPMPSAPNNVKHPAQNLPKVLAVPPVKKKENLEVLKEELRKKQEILEQKRNEFRQQLDKLQKHATEAKGEVPEVQPAKKLKVEGADDSPKQSNLPASGADLPAEGSVLRSQPVEYVASPILKTKPSSTILEPSNLKHAAYPLAYVGSPFPTNRYKLDNRPTSFRVNAPLPTGFTNVNALSEHFAVFGEVSNIELGNPESQDKCSKTAKNIAALVGFKTRQSAERAFTNGKSWKGHSLQLAWLIPSKPRSSQEEKPPASVKSSATELEPLQNPTNTNPQDSSGERGSSLSAAKDGLGTEIQSVEKSACGVSQDSCGGSQASGAETQSADKSAVGSSQEASVSLQVAGKVGEMESDEKSRLKQDPATGGTEE